MAAVGRHGGHYIQKNSRFLLSNLVQLWCRRSFGWTPALSQQTAEVNNESPETIVIPRKKTWSKEAVLKALASTVRMDPTAYPYLSVDDQFLCLTSSSEFNKCNLSKESGKAAAKYFINTFPKFFTKDFAEPHIPCLMPEIVKPLLEGVSEEALKELIGLRKVTAAVDMYDKVLQSGEAVSMETSRDLLDLICMFCDQDPADGWVPQTLEPGDAESQDERQLDPKPIWKKNNNAERIFNLLPERDVRCYSALIRGMVKHEAYESAFSLYTDLLNDRLTADAHIFNALILAVPNVKELYNDRWELVSELLTQMHQQKVRPNLHTFNAVLKTLKSCGPLSKSRSRQTLKEMKALGIAPSLASYAHVLSVFQKSDRIDITNIRVLEDIIAELEGTSFTCQDPDDVTFFSTAMRICLNNHDLETAYEVNRLTEVGDNWRLLGDPKERVLYYSRFFSLLCAMEDLDVVLEWYRRHCPSMFYPSHLGMGDLLRAVNTENRLEIIPKLWEDIKIFGLENRQGLVKDIIFLMAKDKHIPEVQESFAECILDIMSVYDGVGLKWSDAPISEIASLLLRANKTEQAWDMLQHFKRVSKVPSDELLMEFLLACQRSGSAQKAVELVQLSATFCLEKTPVLAKKILAQFELTDEQRAIVSELDSAEDPPTEPHREEASQQDLS